MSRENPSPCLRLKPGFRHEIIPSVGVFLLSESDQCLLRGRAYEHLAPLLDGRYSFEQLVARLQDRVSPRELFNALDLLRAKGYIVNVTAVLPSDQLAFWARLGIDSEQVVRRLGATTVAVKGFGDVDTGHFAELLGSLGVTVVDDASRAVVLTDDYLSPGLDAFNRQALADGHPWLICKPVGAEVWLGPLFTPGRSGCWECLAQRLRGHRTLESFLREQQGHESVAAGRIDLPTVRQAGFGLAATEVAKWLVCGPNPQLCDRIVSLDVAALDKRDHRLVRRPQCPSCGGASHDPDDGGHTGKVSLRSRVKRFTADGGHRTRTPAETLTRLEHHVSPITGIVSDLWRCSTATDEADPTHPYVAEHSFAPLFEESGFDRGGLRKKAGGKGKSDVQARVSALSEAIERYSGVFQGDEPRVTARLDELGAVAVRPNACMGFSRRQYADREHWNARGGRCYRVPEPFDPTRRIEWTPVWSLTSDDTRYVATACCYYGYAHRHEANFARADSNGCAAGSSLEEAILQGFMELVERDAVALWWYNRLHRPAVDIDSFDDPYVQELQSHYARSRRGLWLLDITSDLGIPVFAAVSSCRDDRSRDAIILGFGAHFDPTIALSRALTELNQSLPAVLAGAGNDFADADPDAAHWWRTATLANQPYLLPDESLPAKTRSDYPALWSDDLHADVMRCARVAGEHGLETLVLDQTRPDTGLHVAKVMVPGLRHFWPRFGPGRLYDVPVKMGWLPAPLGESELNPHAIYF